MSNIQDSLGQVGRELDDLLADMDARVSALETAAQAGPVLPEPAPEPEPVEQPGASARPGFEVRDGVLYTNGRAKPPRLINTVFWAADRYDSVFEDLAKDPRYAPPEGDRQPDKGWFAAILKGCHTAAEAGFNGVRLTFQDGRSGPGDAQFKYGHLSSTQERQIRAIEAVQAMGLAPMVEWHDLTGDSTLAAKDALVDEAVFEGPIFEFLKSHPEVAINFNEMNFLEGGDPSSSKDPEDVAVAYQWYAGLIVKLRGRGLRNVLVIDGARCHGQDPTLALEYGRKLMDADSARSVVMSIHCYGYWHSGAIPRGWPVGPWNVAATFARLGKVVDDGVPVIVGEFGFNDLTFPLSGPQSNEVQPYLTSDIISAADAHGIGLAFWCLKDNDSAHLSLLDGLAKGLSDRGKALVQMLGIGR